jgi:hypothetical protein
MRFEMRSGTFSSLLASGVLLLGSVLLAAGTSILNSHPPTVVPSGLTSLVGLGVTIFGILVVLWFGIGFCAALAAELLAQRGHHHAARYLGVFVPMFMRRAACLALGTSLVAAQPVYAHADPASSSSAVTAPLEAPGEPSDLDPQWIPVEAPRLLGPSWQPTVLPPGGGLLVKEARESRSVMTPATDEIIVRPGDSLWAIAARHIGPQAADVQIAEAWPHWYAANKDLIGDNPDLLQPGQVLRPPAATPTQSK